MFSIRVHMEYTVCLFKYCISAIWMDYVRTQAEWCTSSMCVRTRYSSTRTYYLQIKPPSCSHACPLLPCMAGTECVEHLIWPTKPSIHLQFQTTYVSYYSRTFAHMRQTDRQTDIKRVRENKHSVSLAACMVLYKTTNSGSSSSNSSSRLARDRPTADPKIPAKEREREKEKRAL